MAPQIFNVRFQPGLIASDEDTKAMAEDKGEPQSTAIFGQPSSKGLVEKITGRSASFSNSGSGPKSTKFVCVSRAP